MIRYMALMWASTAMVAGCGQGPFEPLTPLTVAQWESVNHVEGRVEAAIILFKRPAFKVRPQITVVTSSDQFIPKFQRPWKDVPAYYNLEPRVEGEGVSGMWDVPDIFISTIGDRAAQFRSLYAHERAHTFFGRGSGHPDEWRQIKEFLEGG